MHTYELPPRLSIAAADQAGVFSAGQALNAGLDRHEMTRLVAGGYLRRIRRGAYILARSWANSDEQDRHILTARAVLLGLSAPCVLSHSTAVVVAGLRQHELVLDTVHVTHDPGLGSSRREAGVTHHSAALVQADRSTAIGLPITADARTAIDVARCHSTATALVVADHVLGRSTTRDQLKQALYAASDHPGARTAGRVVSLADGRSESVGETLGRLAFDAVDLAPDELQLPLRTDWGTVRADYAWTRFKLVGEFDGRIKYGRLLKAGQSAQDVLVNERQRELAIERTGWLVVRFTWAEVFDHELVRTRLREAMARSRALGLAS